MVINSPHDENGQGDSETRPHTLRDVVADVSATVGLTELEQEQLYRVAEKDSVRCLLSATLLHVPQQRLVIASLRLPLFDSLGGDVALTEMEARHVLWRVDDEEQDEGNDVDAYEDRKRVSDATYDVSDHLMAAFCCAT